MIAFSVRRHDAPLVERHVDRASAFVAVIVVRVLVHVLIALDVLRDFIAAAGTAARRHQGDQPHDQQRHDGHQNSSVPLSRHFAPLSRLLYMPIVHRRLSHLIRTMA